MKRYLLLALAMLALSACDTDLNAIRVEPMRYQGLPMKKDATPSVWTAYRVTFLQAPKPGDEVCVDRPVGSRARLACMSVSEIHDYIDAHLIERAEGQSQR